MPATFYRESNVVLDHESTGLQDKVDCDGGDVLIGLSVAVFVAFSDML